MYKTYYTSPIGRILILTDANALLGLWLENQKYFGAGYDLEQAQEKETEVSRRVSGWMLILREKIPRQMRFHWHPK